MGDQVDISRACRVLSWLVDPADVPDAGTGLGDSSWCLGIRV